MESLSEQSGVGKHYIDPFGQFSKKIARLVGRLGSGVVWVGWNADFTVFYHRLFKGKCKGKCIYIARFLYYLTLKALRHGSHSVTCNYTNACLYLVSIHQMVPPQTEVAHI